MSDYTLQRRRKLRKWGGLYALPVSNYVVEEQDGYSERVMPETVWHALRRGQFRENWSYLTPEFRRWFRQVEKNGGIPCTITGSEAAAALDASRFKSRLQLFTEKSQPYQPREEDASKAKMFWRGHMAESHVMKLAKYSLAQEYGEGNFFIWTDKRLFACRDQSRSWMLYDPDGFALVRKSEDEEWKFILIEAKTVASYKREEQSAWAAGFVPDDYVLQGRHGMEVMDTEGVLLICAWGFEYNEFAFKFIWRDKLVANCPCDRLGDQLVADEYTFVQKVAAGEEIGHSEKEPVLENTFYGKITRPKPKTLALSPDYRAEVLELADIEDQLQDLKEQAEQLKTRQAELQNRLYPEFADYEYGTYQDDSTGAVYKITATEKYGRNSIDAEGLKRDFPAEYAEMVASETLVPTFKPYKKKKYAALIEQYTIPGEAKGERKWTVRRS